MCYSRQVIRQFVTGITITEGVINKALGYMWFANEVLLIPQSLPNRLGVSIELLSPECAAEPRVYVARRHRGKRSAYTST